MQAKLEQPPPQQVDTTLVPSVTYDLLSVPNKSINVTVIVSQDSDTTPLKFDSPVIGVPGSGSSETPAIWDIFWKVVTGSGLDLVTFTDFGIRIPADGDTHVPDLVTQPIPTELVPDHPDQWKTTITQQVKDVNSFNYKMSVQGQRGGTTTAAFHDPTIVVTLDPMG